MKEAKFLGRKVFDHRDMTWRYEDGSCPIPDEFRKETLIMLAAEQVAKDAGYLGGFGAWWLGKKWALQDFLKKTYPKDWGIKSIINE